MIIPVVSLDDQNSHVVKSVVLRVTEDAFSGGAFVL